MLKKTYQSHVGALKSENRKLLAPEKESAFESLN